jgi:hypothetical protein
VAVVFYTVWSSRSSQAREASLRLSLAAPWRAGALHGRRSEVPPTATLRHSAWAHSPNSDQPIETAPNYSIQNTPTDLPLGLVRELRHGVLRVPRPLGRRALPRPAHPRCRCAPTHRANTGRSMSRNPTTALLVHVRQPIVGVRNLVRAFGSGSKSGSGRWIASFARRTALVRLRL